MAHAVSVIIPVLNDNAALRHCLATLRADTADLSYEIIVCDGGLNAECERIAVDYRARYVATNPGRALQMNAGAALASSTWLWFLHADCLPAAGSIAALARVDARRTWGCFRHRIDAPGIALRVISWADNVRAHLFALPYGDQGIFVRRDVFAQLSGYRILPLLEDVVLAQALSETGAPRMLRPTLRCDARRWLRHGVWKVTWMNWRVMWMYLVRGREIDAIAAYYRSNARSSSNVSGAT